MKGKSRKYTCGPPYVGHHRSTFDLDLHMYVYQERREARLIVVEESVNGGMVLWKVQKKEKHGW